MLTTFQHDFLFDLFNDCRKLCHGAIIAFSILCKVPSSSLSTCTFISQSFLSFLLNLAFAEDGWNLLSWGRRDLSWLPLHAECKNFLRCFKCRPFWENSVVLRIHNLDSIYEEKLLKVWLIRKLMQFCIGHLQRSELMSKNICQKIFSMPWAIG